MRILVLCLTLVLLAASSGRAQDLTFITKVFESVHSVTLAGQGGLLARSTELSDRNSSCKGFGLCGMSAEVLFDLTSPKGVHLEFGLGASYMQGFHENDGSPVDLRGAVKSFPTLSVYLAQSGDDAHIQPYGGINFGLSDLWNFQAYDASGKEFTLRSNTFDYGATVGLYTQVFDAFGIFGEASYRRRRFASVDWSESGFPLGSPREFNLGGLQFAAGVQVDVRRDRKRPAELEGLWVLSKLDGVPASTPIEYRGTDSAPAQKIMLSGLLTFDEANYELLLHQRGSTTATVNKLVPPVTVHLERGNFTASASRGTITFNPNANFREAHTATRAGDVITIRIRRPEHPLNGFVLEFTKPGS